jgi:Cu+-exporting ATPase
MWVFVTSAGGGSETQITYALLNNSALEIATEIQRVVFDKTGTLTQGKMSVVDVQPSSEVNLSPEELLALAAAVEQFSEHPIAKAILAANQQPFLPANEFQTLRGLRVSAQVGDPIRQRVLVGSRHFLQVMDNAQITTQALENAARGETVVWLGGGEILAGYITLRYEPHPSAGPLI